MTKDEALQMCLEYIETDAHERKYVRHAIKAALEAKDEPVAWEGGEDWESLAWQLCADECGEEACTELIWEGGPIPEPWGDRWMKYEYEAKRLIALVRKHTTPPQRKPLVFGLNEDGQFTFSVGVQTFTLDYFPENDEETEFMKRQLTHAIEAAHGIKGEA